MKSRSFFISRPRHTLANVFLTLLWLGFVGLWMRVFQQTRLQDVAASLGLLLGLGGVYGITVAIWVGHNISLARRRNRRKATENITIFPSHDYLGLPVEIRSNLMAEQEIEIKIVNGVKQYLPVNESAGLLGHSITGAGQPTGTEELENLADERGALR